MKIHLRLLNSALILLLWSCSPTDEENLANSLAIQLHSAGAVKSNQLISGQFSLHYVSQNSVSRKRNSDFRKNKTTIVFIHGSPGDWQTFGRQLDDNALRQRANLIALDRPGWGYSALPEGRAETSLEHQAALIAPLLIKLKSETRQNIVLVGHGIGATLAATITMEFPKAVDVLVLSSGILSEDYFKASAYNKILSWSAVRSIIPKTACFANDEFMALPDNLRFISERWKRVSTPIHVFHGVQDDKMNPENASFAETLSTTSEVHVTRIEDAGHYLHITHAEAINELLLRVVNELEKISR